MPICKSEAASQKGEWTGLGRESWLEKRPRGCEGTSECRGQYVSERSAGDLVARMPHAKTPMKDPHHTFLLESSLNCFQLFSIHEVFTQSYSFGYKMTAMDLAA